MCGEQQGLWLEGPTAGHHPPQHWWHCWDLYRSLRLQIMSVDKSEGCMFTRQTTLFLCSCVFPGCRAGPGATEHKLQESECSRNPVCSNRLTETTVYILYFVSKLDQHQEDLSCWEIKKEILPLCLFPSWVDHVSEFCAVTTRKVLTNWSVQAKVMQITGRAVGNKFSELIR